MKQVISEFGLWGDIEEEEEAQISTETQIININPQKYNLNS